MTCCGRIDCYSAESIQVRKSGLHQGFALNRSGEYASQFLCQRLARYRRELGRLKWAWPTSLTPMQSWQRFEKRTNSDVRRFLRNTDLVKVDSISCNTTASYTTRRRSLAQPTDTSILNSGR